MFKLRMDEVVNDRFVYVLSALKCTHRLLIDESLKKFQLMNIFQHARFAKKKLYDVMSCHILYYICKRQSRSAVSSECQPLHSKDEIII